MMGSEMHSVAVVVVVAASPWVACTVHNPEATKPTQIIMRERGSERPRGFGFVSFKEQEAADRVVNHPEQHILNGRPVCVVVFDDDQGVVLVVVLVGVGVSVSGGRGSAVVQLVQRRADSTQQLMYRS